MFSQGKENLLLLLKMFSLTIKEFGRTWTKFVSGNEMFSLTMEIARRTLPEPPSHADVAG
jgi:hypothetical protein